MLNDVDYDALFFSLENKMEDSELDDLLKELHTKKTFQ